MKTSFNEHQVFAKYVFTFCIYVLTSTIVYSQQLVSFVNGGGLPIDRTSAYSIDAVVYTATISRKITNPVSFKVVAEKGGEYIVLSDSTYSVQPSNRTYEYVEIRVEIPDTNAVTNDSVVIKITNIIGATEGNVVTHSFIIKPKSTVSVSELYSKNFITVSPNPSLGTTFIEFESSVRTNGTLSIHDFTGKSVYTIDILTEDGKNRIEVPVSSLQNGFYFATMNIDNLKETIKFMVRNQ